MRYFRDGEWHQLIRIAGPYHNMLGLVLDEANDGPPLLLIEQLPETDNAGSTRLSEGEVIAAVRTGIERANDALGTRYVAQKIRFVPTDSPPVSVYATLAEEITRRAAAEPGRGRLKAAG